MKISVPEIIEIFNEIEKQPEILFEMIGVDVRENVGRYISELINIELSHFLGRALMREKIIVITEMAPMIAVLP